MTINPNHPVYLWLMKHKAIETQRSDRHNFILCEYFLPEIPENVCVRWIGDGTCVIYQRMTGAETGEQQVKRLELLEG